MPRRDLRWRPTGNAETTGSEGTDTQRMRRAESQIGAGRRLRAGYIPDGAWDRLWYTTSDGHFLTQTSIPILSVACATATTTSSRPDRQNHRANAVVSRPIRLSAPKCSPRDSRVAEM